MSIPQRRMYFYLLDEQERIFKSVGRRAIQKIDESISLTDTNIISKSAGIEYISEDVQAELDQAVYVAIPRFRESDLYDTYEGPTRYDFYYIAEGSHDGNLIVLTLHESGMEELNASITGSRMSAQDSEGRDIEVSARSVIPGILSGTNFNFSWNSSSTDTSIFTYDTEPVSAVLEDFVRVYGLEMEYVVEFDGSEVSERIIKFYDEIGHGADSPVDRISYAHDGISVKKSEARDSIRTAIIGIGSKKDIRDLPHQIVADNEIATRSQLGLSGTHMGRANWLTHSEAESLAKDSKALAESLGARRVQEQVVQSGMTLYESNINFKDYEFKKSEGFPVDKPKGQEFIEIPELTQVNGIKTKTGMKPKVGVSKHTDIINIKELAWLAYHEILEVNRKRITYTASATVLNANIGDFVTIAYPNINLNDTKRVVNISRNRLDDTVEGVTLGDHRAKSALRRAQEVQKKEEEEFVDTFMNQRPGGSNRTRSFNPLGTNFSPRDFGEFGRGNYGTIENPIGRDLFDGGLFESLGLEPGQTVPEAIGGSGGGGSDGVIARLADFRDKDHYFLKQNYYSRTLWMAMNRFDMFGKSIIRGDTRGTRYSQYNGTKFPIMAPRESGNEAWNDPIFIDPRSKWRPKHGRTSDYLDNEGVIKGSPLVKGDDNNYTYGENLVDYGGKTIDLKAGAFHSLNENKALIPKNNERPISYPGDHQGADPSPTGTSIGIYTDVYQHGRVGSGNSAYYSTQLLDHKVGILLNQMTGNVEIMEPGVAFQIDDQSNKNMGVPLSMYVDERAISVAHFYLQNFVYPIIAGVINGEGREVLDELGSASLYTYPQSGYRRNLRPDEYESGIV